MILLGVACAPSAGHVHRADDGDNYHSRDSSKIFNNGSVSFSHLHEQAACSHCHLIDTRVPQKAVSRGGNPLWTHTLSLNGLQLSSSREFVNLLDNFAVEPEDRSLRTSWAV